MSKELTTQKDNDFKELNQLSIREFFKEKQVLDALAMAIGGDDDAFRQKAGHYMRGVMTTVMTDDSGKLKRCTNISIFQCILTAAQLGLDVDAKGHAFLVPFNLKLKDEYGNYLKDNSGKVQKVLTCQLIPGYKGYILKIRSSPIVANFFVEPVYKDDEFKVIKGSDPKIIHVPDDKSSVYGDKAALTHVYAVIKYRNAGDEFEFMTKKEIDVIKNKAPSDKFWGPYYVPMGMKSVVRKFEKKLQLPELHMMQMLDTHFDNGNYAYISDGQIVAEKQKRTIADNKNIDYSVSPEKSDLIVEVKTILDERQVPEPEILQLCMKFLKNDDPNNATLENLEKLKAHLEGK